MSIPIQVFHNTNPIAGKLVPEPRADAAEPDFWRKKDRAPNPAFLRLAGNLLGLHQDAGALTVAFARSMETRLAKIYAAQFARYKAAELFPMSTEIDPGAMNWSYKMIERVGQAGLITPGNARDLPRISLAGQESQMPVVTYGAAYGFNIIEENAANLAQIAIETELAKATRSAIEAFSDKMYCVGLSGTDIVGVTNAPGVRTIPQASIALGTWQTQISNIAAATPALPNAAVAVASAIATDILAAVETIATQTLEAYEATDCVLPTNLYNMIKRTVRSPGFTDDTLLQYLERVTGLTFSSWNALQNAGLLNGSTLTLAGGAAQKTRILVYAKDPDVIELMQAQTFVQLAPQLAGLEYTVNCFERSGGVKAVQPLGIVCIDGC